MPSVADDAIVCISFSGEDRTWNQRKRPRQWSTASSDVLARPRARSPSVHVDTLMPLRMLATARHAVAECWPMQAWHQVGLAERLHLDQKHLILRKISRASRAWQLRCSCLWLCADASTTVFQSTGEACLASENALGCGQTRLRVYVGWSSEYASRVGPRGTAVGKSLSKVPLNSTLQRE